ncbi:MAG: Mycothiol acetyltransferase [Paracidovorax wautersii]|uniref:Mycothiol acetyltransferase n=1 Tax=Paracidovorax wautersii TaxID=1177982 RepID=A0A7V8FPZ0_9BURK|nr:MAG: Mycothiol acetyltransferase [Paracidovorax wautersii]
MTDLFAPIPRADVPASSSPQAAIETVQADYHCASHAQAIVDLLDAYARDPMGGGEPLSAETREHLVPRLAQLPHALTLLAYAPAGDGPAVPVGLLNAFMGFSTFKAQPLINVHDVAVLPGHRGRGVGRALFAHLETLARERGCCKLTLEVLSGNHVAQQAYRRQGFAPYDLGPEDGTAQFWQKWL